MHMVHRPCARAPRSTAHSRSSTAPLPALLGPRLCACSAVRMKARVSSHRSLVISCIAHATLSTCHHTKLASAECVSSLSLSLSLARARSLGPSHDPFLPVDFSGKQARGARKPAADARTSDMADSSAFRLSCTPGRTPGSLLPRPGVARMACRHGEPRGSAERWPSCVSSPARLSAATACAAASAPSPGMRLRNAALTGCGWIWSSSAEPPAALRSEVRLLATCGEGARRTKGKSCRVGQRAAA